MSKRILVAEDSTTMRKIILRSLLAVGEPDATEAVDGEEAVTIFQQQEFDIVLTDWNMPKKNGLEVIQEIRKLNATVPIIMVSTEADKTRMQEAVEAGVSDYLVKPFTADALRAKLARFGG